MLEVGFICAYANILQCIASHQLVEDPSVGDLLYWGGSKTGRFSIKYALKLIRNEQDDQHDTKWELAWKVPTQQRVKVFLWLVLHDRILSDSNRVKRNLASDPRCPHYGNDEDHRNHYPPSA